MPVHVRSAIYEASSVWVSAVSAYEIRLKHRLGKLPEAGLLVSDFAGWMGRENFRSLAVEVGHAFAAAGYDQAHRDPFDRMLIAQAQLESRHLVSADDSLAPYDVERIDARR